MTNYQSIEKFIYRLSMLDLTNQDYLKSLIQELKTEAMDVCDRHKDYHCEYCDCREYDREIKLIMVMIAKIETWIK